MAIKTMAGATPTGFGTAGNDLTTSATAHYNTITSATSDLRTRLWSELVTRDAREKNVFAKFIGGEGSGKPIVEKTDLSAGGSDKVTFTTVAPIRGQGVRGENILKNSTAALNFGTFNVEVDLIRHAVSWTQVLKLMRFTGKTLDQLSAEVMSEWASRMEQDLLQLVLRDTCLNKGEQNLLSAYGADTTNGALEYTEGLSTDIIQEAKQRLIANGAGPMNTGGDVNQEIPGYLFFAPDALLRPLRSDPDYLEAITQADSRGPENKLYSGSYAKWDNNIIANHNIILDTAIGRQGSPLAPVARMPSGLSGGASQGWDAQPGSNLLNPSDGTRECEADVSYFGGTGTDMWANWPGASVSIPGGGGGSHAAYAISADTDYVLIVDKNNDYAAFEIDGFYNASTGTTAGNSHMKIWTQILTTVLGGQGVAGVFANTDLEGPLTFYLCNLVGTPIGYALAMGENALYLARGAVTNEQIFHYDDFANSGNEAHLSAVGVQSVYGMAAYEDTNNRVPGVCLVECVRQVPGLSISAQDPSP